MVRWRTDMAWRITETERDDQEDTGLRKQAVVHKTHFFQPDVVMDYYISPRDCTDWYAKGLEHRCTPTPCGGTGPCMPAADFDMLFRAVGERLRLSSQNDTHLLSSCILECADALEQLHQMLIQDRASKKVAEHCEKCTYHIANLQASH